MTIFVGEQDQVAIGRRFVRFFGTGGICEAYERRGDRLVQFGDIADFVSDAVPSMTRDAVIRRFLLSAKTGHFGHHGRRGTIEQLVDLDRFVPRGRYSLRPAYITVEASPELMRAPCSIWARWLKDEGWPVPHSLEGSLAAPLEISATTNARARPRRDRAAAAVASLYPDGVPVSVTNPELIQQVGRTLGDIGQTSDDTILRAAGRRK